MKNHVSSFPHDEQQLHIDLRLTFQTGNNEGVSLCGHQLSHDVARCRTSRRLSATSLMLPEGSIAVHQGQVQMTVGRQLFLVDVVVGGKHLTDLHESFVFGLRNDEERVESHSQADPTEDQVTVGTHRDLRWRIHDGSAYIKVYFEGIFFFLNDK